MLLEVEVLLAEAGEGLAQPRVGDDRRESLALEPDPGVEQFLRLAHARAWSRSRSASCRRDPGERLARQVEPVGDEPERLLALG